MKNRLYIIIGIIIVSSFNIKAITIESILDSININNTLLMSKNAEMNAKIADIKTSNNLGDTEIGFEYQNGANINGQKYGISISQGFDWPGMYMARSKANNAKIKAAEYEFQIDKLDILFTAKQLCLNVINANRKIKAQTQIYNGIKQLSAEYEKGFKHGEISILDINKLKIELLNVKQALDKSIVERNNLIDKLTALNGNKSIANIESLDVYPNQELHAFETYTNEFSSLDPKLNYEAQILNSSNKEVTMAKLGWLPKFSVGYKYANELGDKFNGVEIGMALPLFSNINKVKNAKSTQLSAEYNEQDILAEKTAEIKSNYAQAVYLRSQIHSYNTVLSDTANHEMLRKALDGGQITLLNYLLEIRYFLEAEQTLLDLEFEYNSVLTTLNKYNLL